MVVSHELGGGWSRKALPVRRLSHNGDAEKGVGRDGSGFLKSFFVREDKCAEVCTIWHVFFMRFMGFLRFVKLGCGR
jgi:hypothetical protein